MAETDIADSLAEEFGSELNAPEGEEVTGEEESSTPEPEETEAQAEEEPEQEEQAEPEKPGDPQDEEKPWTYHAYKDEREKRQKYEKEVDDLRARLAQLEKSETPERPDVFQDQDGAFSHIEQATKREIDKAKIALSQDFMRAQHADYDEREAQFVELVKENPELAQRLANHANPARFAYETAVKHERLKQLENVEEWEAKKEAEIRARVLAELQAEQSATESKESAKREAITPSLASQKSAEGRRKSSSELIEEMFPQHV